MLFKKQQKKSDMIAKFIGTHCDAWAKMRATQLVLSKGLDEHIRNEDFDKLVFSASIYGAADSYGQFIGASTSDVSDGIKIFLSQYSGPEDSFREIIIAGTMPELSEVVIGTGSAVNDILAKDADPTASYMRLFDRLRSKFRE